MGRKIGQIWSDSFELLIRYLPVEPADPCGKQRPVSCNWQDLPRVATSCCSSQGFVHAILLHLFLRPVRGRIRPQSCLTDQGVAERSKKPPVQLGPLHPRNTRRRPFRIGLAYTKDPNFIFIYIYIQFHETPSRKSQHDRTPSISSITRFLPGLMHGSWFSHLHRPSASSHKFEGPSGSPVACWECFPMVRSSIRAPPPKGMGSCGAKPPLLMSKL